MTLFDDAAAAFPVMLASTAVQRAAWLRAVADSLDAAVDELVVIADDETHLGQVRLRGEVARTTGQLRLFAAAIIEGSYLEATIDHADPGATPPRPDLRRMLRPVGPVAVYAASNFPFAFSVAGGDTASALAVGCPVIVKAHPGHPRLSRRTAELVSAALDAAGAPRGAFALVEGYEQGVALVQHPVIAAAAFTGSVAGGRALFDLASARPDPIPFFGELGSINPVVITEDADAASGAQLAAGLAASFTLGAGQFCTKPGLVFVPRGSAVEAALLQQLPAARQQLLNDAIASGFERGRERLLDLPGVETLADGPAVVAAADSLSDDMMTEVFGPLTLLVRYASRAELVGMLQRLEGSLTATLHAADEPVDDLLPLLESIAGRLLFSGWPTGVAVAWAQQHGGPWPSTTSQHTSVGVTAVRRFLRPIAYQDAPERLLPAALRDANPLGIPRRVDGVLAL
jgi:NADP-dependent aldehyde dehydrogenase